MNATPMIPVPVNEPVLSYAPGTTERLELKRTLKDLSSRQLEIPLVIGGKEVRTGKTIDAVMPHCHHHVLAKVHQGGPAEVRAAIAAAGEAWHDWSGWDLGRRAAVFLKAAELLATRYRPIVNAATMLGQSKTAHQAEIDAACELIDFWRFNPHFAERLYAEQPISAPGTWNLLDYRPLEGFVYAITPFNFTSIGGNLPTAPALMGNTVVWKPAATAVFSNYFILEQLEDEIVREDRRRGRLPDHGVAHERGRRGEVAADRREVERRDRVHEPLERAVVEEVPGTGRGDRLLGIQPLREVRVEAPEIDQLARRIDLRLVRGLRLPEHRRRIDDGAVPRGEELRCFEENGRAAPQVPPGPVVPRFARRRDRRPHLRRASLMHLGEHVVVAVGHHGVDGLAGADLLSADYERDLQLAGGEVLERPLQLQALGGTGGVGEDRLDDRDRYDGSGVHAEESNCGLRIADCGIPPRRDPI